MHSLLGTDEKNYAKSQGSVAFEMWCHGVWLRCCLDSGAMSVIRFQYSERGKNIVNVPALCGLSLRSGYCPGRRRDKQMEASKA